MAAQHMAEEEREVVPRLRKMDADAFGQSSAVKSSAPRPTARKEAMRQLEMSAPM
ncbi:hypothetical protein JYJ95_42220 [Corallococcus exiguus]|uniref:hypothetical protein n=1 Tax=Corallococcus exiguus TaxID=83462 RepID=UPI001A8CC9F5|nr:hypothetical protein [Corallococcus exiguus]MBN8473158.1 hypothetical protein [Corallococcus exiguus]